jgi:hypothetical protein
VAWISYRLLFYLKNSFTLLISSVHRTLPTRG